MKKFFSILTLSLLMCCLIGCGSDSSNNNNSNNDSSNEVKEDNGIELTLDNVETYVKLISDAYPNYNKGQQYLTDDYGELSSIMDIGVVATPTSTNYDYNDITITGTMAVEDRIFYWNDHDGAVKKMYDIPFELKLDLGGHGEFISTISIKEFSEATGYDAIAFSTSDRDTEITIESVTGTVSK